MAIYSRYALPSMRYFMSVHHIHKTHMEELDNMARKYLKLWLSIPSRGATDASIFHPHMLNIKAPSTMYTEAHAGNYTLMRMKGDKLVNHALDSRLERESEWRGKSSTIVAVDRIFSENVQGNKIILPTEDTENSEKIKNIKKAKKATTESVKDYTLKVWNDKIKKLTMQGDFIELLAEEKQNVTWQSIAHNVPKGILSFALKASTNSLNTPDNLKRWGIRKLANCTLCGNHCTLQHILNFCSVSLQQGRLTWRHNSILSHLTKTLKAHNPQNIEILADIPGHTLNGSTVPPDILCTSQRPDLVLVDRTSKSIVLLELTCSFETNADSANVRKKIRYRDLKTDIEASGYKVTLLPFEVGSRGHINKRNTMAISQILRVSQFKIKTKQLYQDMSKIALLCSFAIFHATAQPTWQEPPYLTP